MMKKIIGLVLAASFILCAATAVRVEKDRFLKVAPRKADLFQQNTGKASVFTGTQSGTFDKSANGYGWVGGYNRKIQTNMDPVTGPMFGTIYRQLADTGSGTIGGMIGEWESATFNAYSQSAYTESQYQGGTTGAPGGRYPYACEFINGYYFGLFNDYDLVDFIISTGDISQPMFAVCDATMGWDLSMWSEPGRIESAEGGQVIPGAWLGTGDVAYNPEDGYYYWTTCWNLGGLVDWGQQKYPVAVGRSDDPTNPASWEWTDYNEFILDCSDTENGFIAGYGDIQFAYAKDVYGNGTGFGIAIFPFVDVTYEKFDLSGNPLDVSNIPRLGYSYTTNWGADWSTGDFKSNWQTPNGEGNNLFPAEIDKLFPWYGTVVQGDSIGVDGDGNTIYEEWPLNWAYITWNADVICTEDNIVHVIVKAIPQSTETTEYWWPVLEGIDAGGFYDIVGEITESGLVWHSANYIASYMGLDDGNTEWKYSNTHKMTIGYAGNGVLYASWWDRPETRYLAPPANFTDPDTEWIDDAFFIYSPDHGKTWDHQKVVPYEGASLKYAHNVTKTSALQDEGWSIARHGINNAVGTDNDGVMTVYAACQYYDPASTPVNDPPETWADYQQFLKVWKIKGTKTGIETEDVSMVKDFTLFQNYPNPFNPATEIKFALQNESNVKLSVFNIKGELVTHLKNEKMAKGMHSVNFDAASMNSGVYFYKLDVNGRAETKKMVLTK